MMFMFQWCDAMPFAHIIIFKADLADDTWDYWTWHDYVSGQSALTVKMLHAQSSTMTEKNGSFIIVTSFLKWWHFTLTLIFYKDIQYNWNTHGWFKQTDK